MSAGVVPAITITPGSLVGLYQAPIQDAWNLTVQVIPPGAPIDWSKGGNLLYVAVPGVQAGEVLEVWGQIGIKGAQVYTGRVAVGGGVNIVPIPLSQFGGPSTPPPPSSVGEDWNSDVRPYLELCMHQAFIAPQAGDYTAYMRCYAAVNSPAPGGYLQAMYPHGSILVKRYSNGS